MFYSLKFFFVSNLKFFFRTIDIKNVGPWDLVDKILLEDWTNIGLCKKIF